MSDAFKIGTLYGSNLSKVKLLSKKQWREYRQYLDILKKIKDVQENQTWDQNKEKQRNLTATFIQNFSHQLESQFQCPICQTLVVKPIVLTCSHLFCKTCLQDWMVVVESRGDLRSCPICRKIIRENLSEPEESTSTTSLQIFLRKVKELDRIFHHQESIPEEERSARLLDVLELDRNFTNLETVHILKNTQDEGQFDLRDDEQEFMRQSKMVGCVELIRRLRTAEKTVLMKKLSLPKTAWALFLDRARGTLKLICPLWLPGIANTVKDFIFPSGNNVYTWMWSRPESLFYFWMFFSIVFFFLVITFGPSLLRWAGIKQQIKRLLQHGIFVCLDMPTFEVVNIIYEAFIDPL